MRAARPPTNRSCAPPNNAARREIRRWLNSVSACVFFKGQPRAKLACPSYTASASIQLARCGLAHAQQDVGDGNNHWVEEHRHHQLKNRQTQ